MQYLVLPINKLKPTAGYKNASYKNSWGYVHYGVDCVSADKVTELYGLGNGTVAAAGLDGLDGKTTGTGSGCGYVLVVVYKDVYNHNLKKSQDVTVTYMHMEALPKVKVGDKVTTSTLLGYYGNTGANTTGAHLHIQVDTDINNPLYCCGLSSKGHNVLKKGTSDSTINPVHVFHIGPAQSVTTTSSTWYDANEFKNLPQAPVEVNTYEVIRKINKYKSAADAKNKVNSRGTFQPGTYYIYNRYPEGYKGMYNITTDTTGNSAGSWINPEENKEKMFDFGSILNFIKTLISLFKNK